MNSLSIRKKMGENNPIIAQRFMADPYAIEYKGRVYVYGSNDSDSFYKDVNGDYYRNSYANIKSINCISSDDLVNWTDHGVIQIATDDHSEKKGVSKWTGNSWAPAACYKTMKDPETGEEKDKFFLYFANSANNIGVLTADSPVGPWTDPIGRPLIDRDVPGVAGVEWLFDPAVLVDDDGEAYIYFGGGVPQGKAATPQTGRVAKLGKDMVSIDGEAVLIDAPYLFEDSGINKIGDTYYYSYCSNWSEEAGETMGKAQISYMTSKNPMGPFEYQGEIMKNPGQSEYFTPEAWGNNHHCVLGMSNGIHYMFYHTPQYEIDMNINLENAPEKCAYRTTYVDVMTVDADGKVHVDKMTRTGTAVQLKNVNPFEENKMVTFAWGEGVACEPKNIPADKKTVEMDMSLSVENDGNWIGLSKVDFGDGKASKLVVKAAAEKEVKVTFYADAKSEANIIGTVDVASTGSIDTYSEFESQEKISVPSGIHNLIIEFSGADIKGKVMLDSWKIVVE